MRQLEEDSEGQRYMKMFGKKGGIRLKTIRSKHIRMSKRIERKKTKEGTQPAALDWKHEEPGCVCGGG